MKNRKTQPLLLLLIVVLMIIVVSCNPSKKYAEEEKAQIQDYLAKNTSLNFELKPSGLYFLEIQAGTGRTPVIHDTAYVKYTGKFLDGEVFETNVGKTDTLIFPFNEGWMIAGLEESIGYMKQGGKALVLIPSDLAYRATGWYIIPGYTPILFDLELVKVKPAPAK